MNLGILMTVGFIVFMVILTAGLIGWVLYIGTGNEIYRATTTQTTVSTSTTSTTESTTTAATSTTLVSRSAETLETTSTTSTTVPKRMKVTYSPETIYTEENVYLTVTEGGGTGIRGATVYIDGTLMYQIQEEKYPLLGLEGGEHELTVSKDGYENVTLTVNVDPETYANSKMVRRELTAGERAKALSLGKADIRFYETSFCPNCAAVVRQLNRVVDKNRDCVVYERLVYYKYVNELSKEFKNGESLPFIIIDGPDGRAFKSSGIVSMNSVRDAIQRSTGCDIQ